MAELTSEQEGDLLRRLAAELMRHTGLEAVRWDPLGGNAAAALLGPTDWERIEPRLREVLRDLQSEWKRRDTWAQGNKMPPRIGGMQLRVEGSTFVFGKPTCPTAPQLWQWREVRWIQDQPQEEEEDWREGARDAALCASGLVAGFVAGKLALAPEWLSWIFYGAAIVAGGRDAAVDAWRGIRQRKLDIHFLMLAVALGAVMVGAWGEGALLLFLFSASGAMEAYAAHRTRREISSLLHAAPRRARREREDGNEELVEADLLRPGDIVRLLPGDGVACDAEVLSGNSAVDESALTGESVPVSKGPGDVVLSGTINTWGSLRVRVLRPVHQSALQKIIDLIRAAGERRAPAQRFTDRFGTGYTWAVLGVTAAMFMVWWLVLGVPPFRADGGEHPAFYRAMTLLVVMSPCALVLSVPSAILAAIASGARKGILFRGGAAVETLVEAKVVALDKTGTLTTGELEVARLVSLPSGREREVLEAAAALEAHSTHPIARAILKYARQQGVEPVAVEEFRNLNGQGISGQAGDHFCVLGRRELVARGPLAGLAQAVEPPPPGCSEVWVLRQDLLGYFLLKDQVRRESAATLEEMRELGLRPVMLTGDRAEAARMVAQEIGLREAEIRAGLLPEDKVRMVEELRREIGRVVMVGDGVNDAPSLAAADISVAMGVRGSDAALEQSDVVLMKDRIDLFLHAWKLSRATRQVMRQNVAVALGTVVVMALAALTGKVPLSLGVLAHEGSTVLVCLNSLRLLFLGESRAG